MVQSYMSTPYILAHGSDYLKEKYLPKAISGEWICSIAISEPSAGSDVMNIQTKPFEMETIILLMVVKHLLRMVYMVILW